MGMTTRAPSGVFVKRPDSADIESLADAWDPVVLVRAVTSRCVLWIDPLLYTVMATRPGRGPEMWRDGLTRMMREPEMLVVGHAWFAQVLTADGWHRIAAGCVESITVVTFPCGGEGHT